MSLAELFSNERLSFHSHGESIAPEAARKGEFFFFLSFLFFRFYFILFQVY